MPWKLTCVWVFSAVVVSCSPQSREVRPLTDAERVVIEEAIRARVLAFADAQRNHERLCEDPSEVHDHFAYPGGRLLLASDTTPVFYTQDEWEAEGLPASYWCSIESVDIQFDSVVVHVLTRDVAVSAAPLSFSRVMKSGQSTQAKGMSFETWVLTNDGWKSSSAFDYYEGLEG